LEITRFPRGDDLPIIGGDGGITAAKSDCGATAGMVMIGDCQVTRCHTNAPS
jgi:hypothetical protein